MLGKFPTRQTNDPLVMLLVGTLPETNSSPLKICIFQKETRKYYNHPFSGAFAVSFREGNLFVIFMKGKPIQLQYPLVFQCLGTNGCPSNSMALSWLSNISR